MRTLILAMLLFLLPGLASADIFYAEPPAEWADKEVLQITVLETDRSDAILVTCGGEAMLIDGADSSWSKALLHDLEKRGLTEFVGFLNTHPHNDHIEGLLYLMKQGYKPRRFMSPLSVDEKGGKYHEEAVDLAWKKGIPYRVIRNGDTFSIGGAELHIYRTDANPGVNDRCAIQLITYGESRILLMADLSGISQKSLMAELPEGALTAEIVKAPHHGETAIVAEVLTALDPQLLIATSLPDGAPALARQAKSRDIPLRYSGEGEVVLTTDGTDWYVVQHAPQGRGR